MMAFSFDFDAVKRAISDTGAQLKTLRQEREQAMKEREDLESLPLAKSDFSQLLEDYIDRESSAYVERLKTGTAYYLRNPLSTLPKNPRGPCHPIRILSATRSPEDAATVIGLEANLFALLAPALKEGLRAIVGQMDFSGSGPERSERLQKIEALDARIIALDAQEKELVEAAEAAGVRL